MASCWLLRACAAATWLGGAQGLRVEADPCACKNWKKGYAAWLVASIGLRCGHGNEFFAFAQPRIHGQPDDWLDVQDRHMMGEICGGFFERIDDNACVNLNPAHEHELGGQDDGQWCYVDAACTDLAGGAVVNKQVSWKYCSPEKDRMTRLLSPPELVALADRNGISPLMLDMYSYPWGQHAWTDVSSYWGDALDDLKELPRDDRLTKVLARFLNGTRADDLKDFLRPLWGSKDAQLPADLAADMRRVAESGVPTSFDIFPANMHPMHVIVQGRTVYLMILGDALLCVSGCKK